MLGKAAGALRFASAAHFAMRAGVAPLPGLEPARSNRYRLNRRGDRRLDAACKLYLAIRPTEGTSTREGLRCLKRHVAHRLAGDAQRRDAAPAYGRTPAQPPSQPGPRELRS